VSDTTEPPKDPRKCAKCGGRVKFSRVRHYDTFDEKRRDCACGWSDKIHVRIREEVLAVIAVAKRTKRVVRLRTLQPPQKKTIRNNQN